MLQKRKPVLACAERKVTVPKPTPTKLKTATPCKDKVSCAFFFAPKFPAVSFLHFLHKCLLVVLLKNTKVI